jgi:hypothetical protein
LLVGLLLPMVVRFVRPLLLRSVERIANNESNMPIEKVVEDIMMDRLELVKKNKPLIKTIAIESSYHPELLKPIQEEAGPVIIEFVDRFLKKQTENGEFRDLDSKLLSRTMMSLLLGYVVLTSILPNIFEVEDDREEIKKIVDVFLNGVKNRENE